MKLVYSAQTWVLLREEETLCQGDGVPDVQLLCQTGSITIWINSVHTFTDTKFTIVVCA